MRECGMLLPIASLPSKYGIGCFSKEAYEFVDQLKEGGQSFWQILPLGPTGFGDSPYQAFSAFAGNPYFIDLEQLIQEGLLTENECEEADFGDDDRYIAYDKIYKARFKVLKKAYERWKKEAKWTENVEKAGTKAEKMDHRQFLKSKLDPETREYCFYMAVKDHFKSASWNKWDEDIRLRKTAAVEKYKKMLEDEMGFYEFQQFQFNEQWSRLKAYANENGIQIIGDIPIYVAFDGADSWAHPELFQFDGECLPKAVAGCPPDAFSATGQLWGNPLYDWGYHKKDHYSWWIKRMEYCLKLYDVVRVDHFRGFEAYYSIPYGDLTAEFGHWEKGPGLELFDRLKKSMKKEKLPIIAEDLGFLTPQVHEMLKESGFPGMKVLEFAFDDTENSDYLPHKYTENSIVYTGTHDNETLVGWYETMSRKDKSFAREYMGCHHTPKKEMHWEFIRLAMASPAKLAVIPVQDYLGLGKGHRMNVPGTASGNWTWRMLSGEATTEIAEKLYRMTKIYGRLQK